MASTAVTMKERAPQQTMISEPVIQNVESVTIDAVDTNNTTFKTFEVSKTVKETKATTVESKSTADFGRTSPAKPVRPPVNFETQNEEDQPVRTMKKPAAKQSVSPNKKPWVPKN